MGQRYRVKGQVNFSRKPKSLLGKYDMPNDAVWLAQDIGTLEIMQSLLNRLQPRSFVGSNGDFSDRLNEAHKTLRRLAFLIELLRQVAEQNLVSDYLCRTPPKRTPKLTIADVWQLMLDGFKT